MNKNIKKAYQDELSRIHKEIEFVEKIDSLNNKLRKSNWLFIHPYNFGFETKLLEEVIDNENAEREIFEIYANTFLDLRTTIAFVEGFYKKRPFLGDFLHIIEKSIVLCLQKDFAGAINFSILFHSASTSIVSLFEAEPVKFQSFPTALNSRLSGAIC